MLGIDRKIDTGVRVGQPGKLHDRPASGVDDRPFDIRDVSFYAVTVSRHERDRRRRGGGLWWLRACAHRVQVWRGQCRPCGRSLPSRPSARSPFRRREYGCYGEGTGETIVREVLIADAANLSHHV